MSSDAAGVIALLSYAAVLVAAVVFRLKSYSSSWRESLFTLTLRVYLPMLFGQRARERCPWPEDGPALIVANHTSPVDPLLVHAASLFKTSRSKMRIVEWLTAKEYCQQPGLIGTLCDIARCIPVSREGRDMAAVRQAIRRAQDGRLIGIFPEGGLNGGPGLRPFNTGVAFLALAAKVPVYPVFIEDAPRGTTMVNSFLTRSRTRVHFGEQVDLSRWTGQKPNAQTLDEVTHVIRQEVARLGAIDPDPEPVVAGRIARAVG